MRPACVVCKLDDERGLLEAPIGNGMRATMCGTHHLVYQRSGRVARDAAELVSIVKERRDRSERRHALADDMVAQLADAFATEKRTGTDRRG